MADATEAVYMTCRVKSQRPRVTARDPAEAELGSELDRGTDPSRRAFADGCRTAPAARLDRRKCSRVYLGLHTAHPKPRRSRAATRRARAFPDHVRRWTEHLGALQPNPRHLGSAAAQPGSAGNQGDFLRADWRPTGGGWNRGAGPAAACQ